MRFHQLASTLLVLCLTGCGASPANSPTPASNFGGTATSPIAPTVSQSADPVVATGTDGGT
ncbi:MAG: hypothetical protein H7338_22465, partial [Candidatus Sericytochromatia bacterium]|nr:hypothetical protein [Candidatus Sericytochromatia bacterium]